jgi:hypothetical protein
MSEQVYFPGLKKKVKKINQVDQNPRTRLGSLSRLMRKAMLCSVLRICKTAKTYQQIFSQRFST